MLFRCAISSKCFMKVEDVSTPFSELGINWI
jgi:hypothetical protein